MHICEMIYYSIDTLSRWRMGQTYYLHVWSNRRLRSFPRLTQIHLLSSRCLMFFAHPLVSRRALLFDLGGLFRLFHHRLSTRNLPSSPKRRRSWIHVPLSQSFAFSLVGWCLGWIKESLHRWSRKRKNAQKIKRCKPELNQSWTLSHRLAGDHANLDTLGIE